MLKTLRITSVIAVILAVSGVGMITVFGLKGDRDIQSYLDKPGIVDVLKKKTGDQDNKEEPVSPLVNMAKAIALRLDPPPPPAPVTPPADKTPPRPVVTREPPKPAVTEPPRPKVQASTLFSVLATVRCDSDPSKSMTLLQMTGNKQEWFRQGERVGHLDIQEVRDGSVVFSQDGRNPQEKFVPAKTQVKSLLKSEQGAVSSAARPGADTINVLSADAAERSAIPRPGTSSVPTSSTADTGAVRVPRRSTDVASRIGRARSVPKEPSPEEQKAELEESIKGLEELMGAMAGPGVSEEQQQQDLEAWKGILEVLKQEKANMEASMKGADADSKDSSGDPNNNTD